MQSRFERFSFTISALYRYIQKIEADEMKRYGLKGPYAQYLSPMSRHPEGLTAARLCDICEKDKAAVSRAVAEMEQKGLIQRKTTGETGYRALLVLTDLGKEAAAHVCKRAQLAVDLAGHGLTDSDRTVLYETLEKIAGNLRILSKDGMSSGANDAKEIV